MQGLKFSCLAFHGLGFRWWYVVVVVVVVVDE